MASKADTSLLSIPFAVLFALLGFVTLIVRKVERTLPGE